MSNDQNDVQIHDIVQQVAVNPNFDRHCFYTYWRSFHDKRSFWVCTMYQDTDRIQTYLVSWFLLAFFSFCRYESSFYQATFPYIIYPFAGLSMTGSTYLCVAIAAERYLGICHRTIQIHRKFRFYLIGIIVWTLVIEFPRFFELEGMYDSKGETYTYR